ncbi:MAG: glycerol-3-phosphate 1-O-acyltransferase PlsY [Candidatus Omnitrophota bacterium]
MRALILLAGSYLIGSIPFGFLAAYLSKGIDIRSHGSGNTGATNVFRVIGAPWGIAVFFLDFAKGFLPPFLFGIFIKEPAAFLYILSVVAAVCGHNWPVFLEFKGGKGVATSLGALFSLSVIFPGLFGILLLSLASWILVFYFTKYVSLASLASGAVFLFFSILSSLSWEIKLLSVVLFVLIVLRHKGNIQKLIKKSEHRF